MACGLAISGGIALSVVVSGGPVSGAESNPPPATATAAARQPNLAGLLAEPLAIIEQQALPFDAQAAARAGIAAMLAAVDPLARVVSSADLAALRAREQGFVYMPGVRLATTNGVLQVAEFVTNSAAARSGLARGDQVLEIAGLLTANASPGDRARWLRGTSATEAVTFRVLRPDRTETNLAVPRDWLRAPVVEAVEPLPENLAVVKINGLYEDAAAVVAVALAPGKNEKRRGVILDLRGAGGTNLAAAVAIAGSWARPGAHLGAIQDRNGQDVNLFKAPADAPGSAFPVILLVDGATSGAAEVLAALCKGSLKGVLLVGMPTQGDLLLRQALPLAGGDFLWLATRQWVTADGQVYTGAQGVPPDIRQEAGDYYTAAVQRPVAGRRALLDEEIEDQQLRQRIRGDAILGRAVELLLALEALDIRHDPAPSKDPAD